MVRWLTIMLDLLLKASLSVRVQVQERIFIIARGEVQIPGVPVREDQERLNTTQGSQVSFETHFGCTWGQVKRARLADSNAVPAELLLAPEKTLNHTSKIRPESIMNVE
jgi:hypothetical protein